MSLSVFNVQRATPTTMHSICNDRAQALRLGMDIFCDAIEQISQYVRQNQNIDIVGNVKEGIQCLDEHLDRIVKAVEDVTEANEEVKYRIGSIDYALKESLNSLDWIASRFPVATGSESSCDPASDTAQSGHWVGHVNNAGIGGVFNSFHELYKSQEQ